MGTGIKYYFSVLKFRNEEVTATTVRLQREDQEAFKTNMNVIFVNLTHSEIVLRDRS